MLSDFFTAFGTVDCSLLEMVSFLCFYKTVILTFLHPHRLLFLPPYHLAAVAQQTTPKQRLTATVYSFTQSCRLAASRWAALALPVILAGVPYAAIVIRSSGGLKHPGWPHTPLEPYLWGLELSGPFFPTRVLGMVVQASKMTEMTGARPAKVWLSKSSSIISATLYW